MKVHRLFAGMGVLLGVGGCSDHSTPLSPLVAERPSLIFSGSPDNGAHPYVGLVVFDDAKGPAWRCTGALLSSTVVLTAGHCTDGAVAARIWMEEVVQGNAQYPFAGTTSYEGNPHTFPGFCIVDCTKGFGMLSWIDGDVGIVVLSEPVPTSVVSSYALLPSAGLVDELPNGATIGLTGYGDQFKLVGGGPPGTAGLLVRRSTTATVISGQFSNSDKLLRLSSTSSQGRGSACFGDSGGPNLVGNSGVTVAVNSYGTNGNCVGTEYSMRIDRPVILNWIQSFLH
jgi:secreted trypsin-like serine protease